MAAKPRRRGNRWRIQWLDSSGKRRSATYTSEATARAALRKKQVEVDEIRAGLSRELSDQTIAEAAPAWLKTRPKKRLKDDVTRLDNHIIPLLGDKKLSEVSVHIQTFIRDLEKRPTARKGERNEEGRTLKPNSIKNILITLRKMMNDLGYPLRIKYKVPKETYSWLRTQADVAKFIEACGDNWFRMAARFAVYAGLRKGEVAGLLWSAIDFERGMIRVDRSYDGPTKGKQARWVPLAPELAAAAKRWRLHHGGRLVVTRDGKPIQPDTEMATRTRRACRRAGVPEVKFHELRDTYASHLAERVSLPIVGAVLGHVDPQTTARYAHIDTEGLARDPRLHLSFAKSDADVIPMTDPSAPVVHQAAS